MSFPARVHAVVLAGGPVGILPLESGDKPPAKGWIRVAGVPMAQRTVAAVAAAERVAEVVLVSPQDADWPGVTRCVPADAHSLMGSFAAGVQACPDPAEPVLVCCGDLPLVGGPALDDFIERCSRRPEAGIWYGFVRKESSLRAYPDLPHTWARFQDGTFCGSGVMMLRPQVMHAMRQAMDDLTHARKHMLKLAGCLGWGNLLDYALGRLTVARAEKAGSRIFRVPCVGVETPFPELGFNVDDREGLRLARRILQKENPSHVP